MNNNTVNPFNEDVSKVIGEFYNEHQLDEDTINRLFKDADPRKMSKETIFAQVLVLDRLYSTRLRDHNSDEEKTKFSPVTVKDMTLHIYNKRNELAEHIENVRTCTNPQQRYEEAYKAIAVMLQVSFKETAGREEKKAALPYSFATKYFSFLCPKYFAIYDSSVEEFLKNEFVKKYLDNDTKPSYAVTGNSFEEVKNSRGYINLLTDIDKLISCEEIVNSFKGEISIKKLDIFIWQRWKENQRKTANCETYLNETVDDGEETCMKNLKNT